MSKSTSYIGTPAIFKLDLACQQINEAFGGFGCYLVGSATERPNWRDVDVRFIMTDEEFKVLFPKANVDDATFQNDPRWILINSGIADYLTVVTGLPIDFQIQPQKWANEVHDKPRHPLGLKYAPREE